MKIDTPIVIDVSYALDLAVAADFDRGATINDQESVKGRTRGEYGN
jgi:hypothetical protein